MVRNSLLIIVAEIFLLGCSGSYKRGGHDAASDEGVFADSGMVVSAHYESSSIGVAILKKGGNAVDAAVATEFALAVCYPEAGNIGGGGFMIYRSSDGLTDVIDYRETAPAMASSSMFLDDNGNVTGELSTTTHLASGVPGTVDGMLNIHSKYGLLPFRDVIQPAINLALKGFPITALQAGDLNNNRSKFVQRNRSQTAFVKDTPWKEGDTLRQPELAHTLERIRDFGREGFYSGLTAQLVIKEMNRGNGIITAADLEAYHSVFRDPLSADYRGYHIITAPPPSGGGIILLQLLGMIEQFNLKEMGFHSPESIHLMTEAERRAFADRAEFHGDPDFMTVPVVKLIDREYLALRMKDFNPAMASESDSVTSGAPLAVVSEETTHYSVVDYMGNAVSATTTLNGTFGSSIVVDSAGFLLNNQMDDFSLKPGSPNMYGLVGGKINAVQPGKRMLSSMTPVILIKDGKLFLVAGSPGGPTIPTTIFQVVVNIIDYGMDIKPAIDTGRFHHQWLPDYISYENNSIDSSVIIKLSKIGHTLKIRPSIGRVNAIHLLPDGRKSGGADRRGNNAAIGY